MSEDRAQSFGEAADLYDRVRPRYPEAVITRIVAASGVRSPRVLDVGCGTGIATVQLLAAGCEVVGLEPDEAMLDVARERTGGGASFQCGRFVDVDAAAGQFDVITAAQSWHWVDPETALSTAHRLLVSGGVLAPLWNVRVEQTDAVSLALVRLYEEIMPDVSDAFMAPQGGRRLQSEEALRASSLFSGPVVERFAWQRVCTTSQYLDLIRTHSVYRLMSGDLRQQLLAGVAAILDAAGGSFTFGYETVLLLSRRL